jgi:hypothetical protein
LFCYITLSRERIFVARATCSSFFWKNRKSYFESFKKFLKNLDVDDDRIYQRAKFELEIPNILDYTKITNSDRLWDFKNLHRSLLPMSEFVIYSFLHSSKYKVFWFENLHDCRSQHCLHVDLISDSFWNFKMIFLNFSKNELHVARATFVIFDVIHLYKSPGTLNGFLNIHFL